MTPRHPAPDPRLDPDPLTAHDEVPHFIGEFADTPYSRGCSLCNPTWMFEAERESYAQHRPAISRAVLTRLFAVLLILLLVVVSVGLFWWGFPR